MHPVLDFRSRLFNIIDLFDMFIKLFNIVG